MLINSGAGEINLRRFEAAKLKSLFKNSQLLSASKVLSNAQNSRIWTGADTCNGPRNFARAHDDWPESKVLDTGKLGKKQLLVDVHNRCRRIEYFANLCPQWWAKPAKCPGDDFYTRNHEPLGVCFCIGAWN